MPGYPEGAGPAHTLPAGCRWLVPLRPPGDLLGPAFWLVPKMWELRRLVPMPVPLKMQTGSRGQRLTPLPSSVVFTLLPVGS